MKEPMCPGAIAMKDWSNRYPESSFPRSVARVLNPEGCQ